MAQKIDYVVAGIGTGGTICGIARFLKERDPSIKVVAIDPQGSVFFDHFHNGALVEPGRYLLEGLGDEELISCPDFDIIDDMIRISDADAFHATRETRSNRRHLCRRFERRRAVGGPRTRPPPRRTRAHRHRLPGLGLPLPQHHLQRRAGCANTAFSDCDCGRSPQEIRARQAGGSYWQIALTAPRLTKDRVTGDLVDPGGVGVEGGRRIEAVELDIAVEQHLHSEGQRD